MKRRIPPKVNLKAPRALDYSKLVEQKSAKHVDGFVCLPGTCDWCANRRVSK